MIYKLFLNLFVTQYKLFIKIQNKNEYFEYKKIINSYEYDMMQ